MAPKPQELSADVAEGTINPEAIVISGVAGMFPKSYNVKEFGDKLYNKENPIKKTTRWNYNHPEVAQYIGQVPDLQHFDANFFKVHYRLCTTMDSMSKKMLEQTFVAIYDAGINPDQLSGSKVGVYCGTCFSETEKTSFYVAHSRTGFGIAGCSKSMFANRISYWLNAKGPSMSVDQACCSSNVALELACQALMRGDIDSAVVAGASLCLHPQSTIHFGRVINLSKDGITKSFDKNGQGCAKSEAVTVLFLQKAKDALRMYAEIVHVKSNFEGLLVDENGPRYTLYREPETMAQFLKSFYEEAKVSPAAVEYIEGVGAGTPDIDKAELETLGKVFCGKRDEPLLVGSVMSNLGYVEAATGVSAVTKIIIGYENGIMPGNINCDDPLDDVEAIKNGKMQIVTNHTPFKRGLTAVSGVSLTGVNSHILLKGHFKPKDPERYKCNIPYLVTVSGRQKSAVEKILNDLKSKPIDPEELALYHNIHQTHIKGHLGKGYIILDTNEENKTVVISEKADHSDDANRPLWFVYSGMGSQWAGMGKELMRIPIFAAAIERCRQALEPKGIDIVHIITSEDKKIFDNILHSFVGIAAVQIGLTDVLKAMGIVPDKIIGHSVGELGCAYADGCLTAEEMILSAYSRGLVSVQTPFIKGSMAAVGIGYEQVVKLCPPEIEVACHNSSESSTISGPADVMKQFVESLTAKGVFAKEVPCSNIAYHSKYIAEAGPGLLKYLNDVIKTPRARSDRWVSTSIPEERWGETLAKYSSAEYHTNNLLNPVLFEETSSKHIPKNAVLVEVAPHGLLQAILKRSMPNCVNIPLTRRGHADNVQLVLEAAGKLFIEGYYPKVQALYPKVEFPVSTGTPMLGHLIEWAHSEKWLLPLYVSTFKKTAAACKFIFSIHEDEYKYLGGHVVRGKNIYPFSAALVVVWDTLAMTLGLQRKKVSVQFSDLRFLSQPLLHERKQLILTVTIQRGTGKFEVTCEGITIITGSIKATDDAEVNRKFKTPITKDDEKLLKSSEVYKLLNAHGYQYSGEFRGIKAINMALNQAEVVWQDNWVTFIESLIQLNILRGNNGSILQLDSIRNLAINVNIPVDAVGSCLEAEIIDVYDYTRCGAVLIENLRLREIPLSAKEYAISLNKLEFVPHFVTEEMDERAALNVCMQIVAENINRNEINALEIVENTNIGSRYNKTQETFENIPDINVNYSIISQEYLQQQSILEQINVVLVSNLSTDEKTLKDFSKCLQTPNMLIINKEYTLEKRQKPLSLYSILCSYNIGEQVIQLIRWKPYSTAEGTSAVTVQSETNLSHMISTLEFLPLNQKLLIFSTYPPFPKLKDVVWKCRREGRNVNLIMINHEIENEQLIDDLPKSDLAISVLDHGTWGGHYYVPLKTSLNPNQDVMLQSTRIGDIESLEWVEKNFDIKDSNKSGIVVKVHYAAINEIDIKRASGIVKFPKHENETYYGMEFSGVTNSGTRVMGLIDGGSVSSQVKANPKLLWPVPEHWSLEDAATVPLAYCMAFYCLDMNNRFGYGRKVLIHGGSGALGQAAISICLAYDCEVFTTVSDNSKKHFLKKLFPALKEANIGYSRDNSFGDMVLSRTGGTGCDIVLSCVKGVLKNVCLNCSGDLGIVLDTAQLQNQEDYDFGMFCLTRNRSYKAVDFASIFEANKTQELQRLQVLVSEGIARGYVRPLTRVVYAPEHAARAFRLLAASSHRGRVLIDMHTHPILSRRARLVYAADSNYLVVSDNDVVAVELMDYLIKSGIKKIRLVTSEKSNYVSLKSSLWKTSGIEVDTSICQDIWNKNNIPEILKNGSNLQGIYSIVTNVDQHDKLNEFFDNFDRDIRKKCSNLRYFAIINENCDVGEKVTLHRRKNGQPASLIKLPSINMNGDQDDPKEMLVVYIANAIEEALLSQEAITFAQQANTNISLLDSISKWTGLNLQDQNPEDTLLSLGVNAAHLQIVQACMKDYFNIWLHEGDIANLNKQKIKEIEESVQVNKYKETDGLSTFYTFVDSDELLATTDMTFLTTQTMSNDELDAEKPYLCIIPGVEGHHYRFQDMCRSLKLGALVLQPTLGLDESSADIAKRFAEILLRRTTLKKTFYLLGFESGVMIALEMAAILEQHGLTGIVYCVGGSPKDIQLEFENKLKDFQDDKSLQDAVCKHMMKLITGNDNAPLERAVKEASSWEEKVQFCLREIVGKMKHSNQYSKELIESAYSRINQVRNYVCKPLKLRSQLILIQANLKCKSSVDSLQQYSLQPIIKYDLNVPLTFAPNDLMCPAIINRHLSQDILEDFKTMNLCDRYLPDADSFMFSADDEIDKYI